VEAERCYSRALDQRDLPDRLAALRGRGLMRGRVGRHHDAVEDLRLARALCHAAGDVAGEIELLLDEATAFDWRNEFSSSEACVKEARELAAALADPEPLLLARLHLGVGRSLHRFSREDEAAALLQRAAGEAAALGDEGYETRVIAMVMLGFIHQGLDRLDAARVALDEVIALCEEHRDDLHLAVAINNRALLRACLGDRAGMLADMERGLALARRLGQAMLELVSRYNLAEYLGLMDDAAEAEPHLRRALEIDRRLNAGAGRPLVDLLAARLSLCRADEPGARATLGHIRAHQAHARAAGHHDALMVPAEEALCDAVELALGAADAPVWDALEARSRLCSVGQEHLEVLDLRALGALRAGRADEALAALSRALEASARIPNVMSARLARRLAEAEAAARRRAPHG
jgi:tetratricopeptide (TPR) repeat protein